MPPAPTRALRACRRNWRALYAIVAPVSLTEIRPSPLFNNLAKSERDPSGSEEKDSNRAWPSGPGAIINQHLRQQCLYRIGYACTVPKGAAMRDPVHRAQRRSHEATFTARLKRRALIRAKARKDFSRVPIFARSVRKDGIPLKLRSWILPRTKDQGPTTDDFTSSRS